MPPNPYYYGARRGPAIQPGQCVRVTSNEKLLWACCRYQLQRGGSSGRCEQQVKTKLGQIFLVTRRDSGEHEKGSALIGAIPTGATKVTDATEGQQFWAPVLALEVVPDEEALADAAGPVKERMERNARKLIELAEQKAAAEKAFRLAEKEAKERAYQKEREAFRQADKPCTKVEVYDLEYYDRSCGPDGRRICVVVPDVYECTVVGSKHTSIEEKKFEKGGVVFENSKNNRFGTDDYFDTVSPQFFFGDRSRSERYGERGEPLRMTIEAKTLGVADHYTIKFENGVIVQFDGSERRVSLVLNVCATAAGSNLLMTATGISGEELASFEMGVDETQAELRAKLAEAVSTPPSSLSIILPNGERLQDADPDTPLAALMDTRGLVPAKRRRTS